MKAQTTFVVKTEMRFSDELNLILGLSHTTEWKTWKKNRFFFYLHWLIVSVTVFFKVSYIGTMLWDKCIISGKYSSVYIFVIILTTQKKEIWVAARRSKLIVVNWKYLRMVFLFSCQFTVVAFGGGLGMMVEWYVCVLLCCCCVFVMCCCSLLLLCCCCCCWCVASSWLFFFALLAKSTAQ